jgi:hypothetical protein
MILDVVYRVPTLRNVLTAVTKNWELLAMTCILGMIIIYIYSLIGFYINYDMWYDRLIGDYGSNQC